MSNDLGPSTPPSTAPTSPRSPTSTDGLVDCEKGVPADSYNEKSTDGDGNNAPNGQRAQILAVWLN